MRIDKIEIKNFRQYRDVTFEFKNNENEDLHIILGKNGMGKTNLLNAITWCIYDQEFHLGNKDSSMPRVNLAAYNEAKENWEKTIYVEVIITVSSNTESIIYSRKQPFTINKNNRFFDLKSEFTVTHMKNNGETKYAYFETLNARFVKLQVVESVSDSEKKFGSAAEIRLGLEKEN